MYLPQSCYMGALLPYVQCTYCVVPLEQRGERTLADTFNPTRIERRGDHITSPLGLSDLPTALLVASCNTTVITTDGTKVQQSSVGRHSNLNTQQLEKNFHFQFRKSINGLVRYSHLFNKRGGTPRGCKTCQITKCGGWNKRGGWDFVEKTNA